MTSAVCMSCGNHLGWAKGKLYCKRCGQALCIPCATKFEQGTWIGHSQKNVVCPRCGNKGFTPKPPQ